MIKRDLDAFLSAEARYRTLVEQIPAMVYIAGYGDNGDWLYMSPQIESVLGLTSEEWLAHPSPFATYLHPDDLDRVKAEEEQRIRTRQGLRSEYRMLTAKGDVVWIRDDATLILDEHGDPLFWQGIMYDITNEKRAEEKAAYLAYHDKLTDLPNRAMFEELLTLAVGRARRHERAVAVVSLDVDNFKLVNDSLGHEAGDELLRGMGARLRDVSEATDLVARQGGDEFLLLLADLDLNSRGRVPDKTENSLIIAETVATRIQDALETPFQVAGTECYLTASMGIGIFPFHGLDGQTLLRNADAAMYRSKRLGPGGYVVHSEDLIDLRPQLSFTTQLRKAVERQEWVLHYQPIVELASGRMEGVEALVRWQVPNAGLVSPGDFISLAEEMGLIGAIGDWVVKELCRQMKEWHALGLRWDVSFNLSPRQLRQPKLTQRVLSSLGSSEVDPRSVIVEITESTAMTDPDRTRQILWDLHGSGLRLAIDDFGTGYSSLSRLKHLPVDILKIDRSFIRDIPGDRAASSMVEGIIRLAGSLGMIPLAEGVETEDQLRFLMDHGCTQAQGYYFSRPLPAAEISARFGGAEDPSEPMASREPSLRFGAGGPSQPPG